MNLKVKIQLYKKLDVQWNLVKDHIRIFLSAFI